MLVTLCSDDDGEALGSCDVSSSFSAHGSYPTGPRATPDVHSATGPATTSNPLDETYLSHQLGVLPERSLAGFPRQLRRGRHAQHSTAQHTAHSTRPAAQQSASTRPIRAPTVPTTAYVPVGALAQAASSLSLRHNASFPPVRTTIVVAGWARHSLSSVFSGALVSDTSCYGSGSGGLGSVRRSGAWCDADASVFLPMMLRETGALLRQRSIVRILCA
ncbi:hypothetical protein BJ546DRAFT_454210 [Cryomyces antarcticus]